MSSADESGLRGGSKAERAELSADQALRLAWIWWLALLLIPFFYFIGITLVLMTQSLPVREGLSELFFLLSLLWLLIGTPAAFMLRNYCFRAYWEGRPVEPRSYLKGMLTIWFSAEIGGLLALTGVLISGQLLPGLLPAAVAFMLFTPFWPNGSALYDTVGDADDEEVYHEPR